MATPVAGAWTELGSEKNHSPPQAIFEKTFRPKSNGRLGFGPNDDVIGNNKGLLTVTVTLD